MRIAEHLPAIRAWYKQRLSALCNADVLRPGIVGVRLNPPPLPPPPLLPRQVAVTYRWIVESFFLKLRVVLRQRRAVFPLSFSGEGVLLSVFAIYTEGVWRVGGTGRVRSYTLREDDRLKGRGSGWWTRGGRGSASFLVGERGGGRNDDPYLGTREGPGHLQVEQSGDDEIDALDQGGQMRHEPLGRWPQHGSKVRQRCNGGEKGREGGGKEVSGGRAGGRDGGGREGVTHLVYGRSRMTINPRIRILPGWSTSVFHQADLVCARNGEGGGGVLRS